MVVDCKEFDSMFCGVFVQNSYFVKDSELVQIVSVQVFTSIQLR